MNGRFIYGVVAIVLSSMGQCFSLARAADVSSEALLACAQESNDARRLHCFDALVADLRGASAVPPVAAAAAGAAATTAPAATTPHPAPAVTPEDRFGARGELKREKQPELSDLTATVTEVGTKPYGELVLTLDNGHVWAEIAANSKLKVKVGDTVKIERGALGSFLLIAPSGRSSKVARIR
jgi:hypothetical protein